MDIHFISIAATQDIYLDIWRNKSAKLISLFYILYRLFDSLSWNDDKSILFKVAPRGEVYYCFMREA
mgnify:CR=1 FL=1